MVGTEYVQQFHDEYAEQEWQRVDKALTTRIEYEIHRRFLAKFVRSGDSVLDLGSGPGRHAIDMMRAGAKVTLGDISEVQLNLAHQKIAEVGLTADGYHQLDICDLPQFKDDAFDLIVCIGGALSYVQDRFETALSEITRIAKPGGRMVVGVMSLYGLMRVFPGGDKAGQLATFDQHIDREKLLQNDGFMVTKPDSPVIHMPIFLCTNAYLRQSLEKRDCNVLATASANPLTADGMKFEKVGADPVARQNLIELEIALSELPAYADTGEWVIAAAEKLG